MPRQAVMVSGSENQQEAVQVIAFRLKTS